MNRHILSFPGSALAAACLAAMLAIGSGSALADERTWYDIEIIIFEQREAGGHDRERWRSDAPDPIAGNIAELSNTVVRGNEKTAFATLPSDRLQLRGLYRRLEQADDYRPLLHLGWRQEGFSRTDAPSVALPQGWMPRDPEEGMLLELNERLSQQLGRTDVYGPIQDSSASAAAPSARSGPPLYGLVRLYRERFLHVAVDLRYFREGGSDIRYSYLNGEEPLFTMTQRRRMRSGELHYLDHPVLGVLVQVTPVE
ncbi:hypothetical protein CAI21_21245 [Alkalilimnicola ehrlichii]|uniref:Peptidoglycan-binding protein CsiV n=1 Tax=Alkalilimnicola ehrlichii TaxID=351052 RepID=A0A3E0WLE2_9GAMM|nr:CsiV family protein [Alkalilimnicola ehrlichii]RFA24561.1 hypothetical protein CAI21_21245 [Alkalilimnicola ehrlichii]RFA33774.1 hypothetical protein CAL65_16680 [Alkalilimnicola ehrlichii]